MAAGVLTPGDVAIDQRGFDGGKFIGAEGFFAELGEQLLPLGEEIRPLK